MSESKATMGRSDSKAATLWRYVGIVAAAHVILIAVLSPGLYWASGPSLQEQLEEGEAALEAQDYETAMAKLQAVLDAQPEPAPIFVKAAELHRRADRMQRTQGPADKSEPSDAGSTTPQTPTTQPPKPATDSQTPARPRTDDQPAKPGEVPDFIPPELRLGD